MSGMGDVLAGFHTVWEFDTDSVLIRFERGIRTPKLLQVLGERRVPYEALAAVEQAPGKHGTVVLRAVPRPGADPLADVADGQLKEGCDPYRLVLPAERELLAEYYAEEIRGRLGPYAAEPAERHLVAAPEPPLSFKAYDGKASFDGTAVSFRWFWTGASSAKWKAGDRRFEVSEITGVEWRSPDTPPAGTCGSSCAPRTARSRTRPTRTRRPWSSAGATGSSTNRCPSRRRSSPRYGPRLPPSHRAPCPPPAPTRAGSPSASGTWASCTRRGC
ncbi:hypothetical protein GCM10020000_56630 [Streptomyces olivoverticillatus]